MATPTDTSALLARAARRAHPDPRRRDGHDDPAATSSARPTIAARCLADHAHDLKGDNDLLVLTRPDVDPRDPRRVPRGRRRHHRDQHLQRDGDRAGRLRHLEGRVREINLAAARIARECADAWTARTPDKPRFVAGALGPTNRTASISPDVNDPGARNVTFDELVGDVRRGDRGAGRRRRRPAPGRDGVRHAERARPRCSRSTRASSAPGAGCR